jgi:hypothetical protein
MRGNRAKRNWEQKRVRTARMVYIYTEGSAGGRWQYDILNGKTNEERIHRPSLYK